MQTRLAKRRGLEETSPAEPKADKINEQTFQTNTNIFENDVVFRLIGDYLPISDLKILRQTSKSLLANVNGLPKFVQNLKLTITDEAIKELNPESPVDWRNAKIVVFHTSRSSYEQIPSNSLTHLKLYYPIELNEDARYPKSPQELSSSRTNCYRFLRSSIFNLKSLTLDINLFRYNIPTTTFSGLVGTLEDLNFTGDIEDGQFDELPRGERRSLNLNMTSIGRLPWRLRSVYVGGEFVECMAGGFAGILVSSRATLEKINFEYEFAFGFLTGIHDLQFPMLKELQFTIEPDDDSPGFTEFLNLQPKLESLLVPMNGKISLDFLEAVRGRCSSSKMRELQFTADYLPEAADFQKCKFAQDLIGLKVFKIGGENVDEAENTLTDILTYLPPTLEEIFIWSYQVPDDKVESSRGGLMSALEGFANLTLLKIRNCGGLFTDDVLQAICRSCTALRSLSFTADHITDFGLTGERGLESSGVSLCNLKGLHVLTMVLEDDDDEIANVSVAGLVKAIQFRELSVAELTALNIPDDVLFQLAKNNPSLEYLTRSVRGRPPISEFAERKRFSKLLSINPRLTRIYSNYVQRTKRTTTQAYLDYGDLSHRPSYGVPGRTLNASTIRRIRSTMKMLTSAEFKPVQMYCYDLL